MQVGTAIRSYLATTKKGREAVYVTTKLAPMSHGYEAATTAIAASLHNLDLEYIDVLLVHWPGKAVC